MRATCHLLARAIAVAALCAGCRGAGEDDDRFDGGGDADTDTDADTDADTDVDADTDADADGGSDADTDTDIDGGGDTDADSDTDTDMDAGADAGDAPCEEPSVEDVCVKVIDCGTIPWESVDACVAAFICLDSGSFLECMCDGMELDCEPFEPVLSSCFDWCSEHEDAGA